MPPVVAYVAAQVAAYVAELTLAKILVSVAISVAVGFVSRALTPSAKKSSSGSATSSSAITRSFREPITTRRVIYGEMRVGGPYVRMYDTSDNKYFHLVIALAGHEVKEIGEIWLEDYPITPDMLDGSGNVTSGKYSGYVRIKKHLGNQTIADSDLVSETDATSTCIGYDTAYIYVRLKWNEDIFVSVPNITAWVKGKKITDPRDDVKRWTPNIALIAHDYLQDVKYGYGAGADELDDIFTSAAANICDEMVSTTDKTFIPIDVDTTNNLISLGDDKLYLMLGDKVLLSGIPPTGLLTTTEYYVIPYQRIKSEDNDCRFALATSLEDAIAGTVVDITGTGTAFRIYKTEEPRYFGGGIIDTSTILKTNLENILSGMAGRCVYSSGSFKLLVGAYNAPTVSLNESHIVGGITVDTRLSRKDRFNTIIGTYISPINGGETSSYPSVTNSTYKTADNNEEIIRSLPLEYTQRPHTAQRIAKIELERSRQEIVFQSSFMLHAMQVRAGDIIMLSIEHYGWEEKEFEVTEWQLSLLEGKEVKPVVKMTLRETDSSVFDWNNGEETAVDPAPNTTLPNAFNVSVVTGFSLDSVMGYTQSGDRIFNILASWEEHENQFVISGGHYEIEYKETTETVYKSAAKVDGTVTEKYLNVLQPDVLYDIRIYAFNNLGKRSQPSLIEGFQVGTTVTTNTEDWENETLSRDSDDWENDTLTSEDWES